MVRFRFEHWDAGGDTAYLYTSDWKFANTLKKEIGRWTTYARGNYEIAWQFRVPNRLLKFLLKRRDGSGVTDQNK